MSDIDDAKRGNWLLPPDEKQLEKVLDYAHKKKEEVEKLHLEFIKMSYLRLFWDSKIPEKDKRFYYFISKTFSKPLNVYEEMGMYNEFYKDLIDAVIKVSNEESQTDSEKVNPFVIIIELNEKLSKMAKAAKLRKYTTSSSAVYNLHESFIQEFEELESMVKKIEGVVLKQGYQKATIGWKESLKRMNGLESEMRENVEKFDELSVKFEKRMLNSEKIFEEQKNLAELTQKMAKQQEIFLRISEKMDEEQGYQKATIGWKESSKRMNGLESEMRENVEKFDKLSVKFEKVMLNSEKIFREQKNLAELTQKMEKQQEIFLRISEKMDEEHKKMYRKNLKVEEEETRLLRKTLKWEEEQEKLLLKKLEMEEKEKRLRKKNRQFDEELEKLREKNRQTEEKQSLKNKMGMKKKRYCYKKYP